MRSMQDSDDGELTDEEMGERFADLFEAATCQAEREEVARQASAFEARRRAERGRMSRASQWRRYYEERARRAEAMLKKYVVNLDDEVLMADAEEKVGGTPVKDRSIGDPRARAEFAEQILDQRGIGILYAEWDQECRCPWGLIPPDETTYRAS